MSCENKNCNNCKCEPRDRVCYVYLREDPTTSKDKKTRRGHPVGCVAYVLRPDTIFFGLSILAPNDRWVRRYARNAACGNMKKTKSVLTVTGERFTSGAMVAVLTELMNRPHRPRVREILVRAMKGFEQKLIKDIEKSLAA